MLRKYFLFPVVLAIVCMLGSANNAIAQRYRGRGNAAVNQNYGWRGGYSGGYRSPYYSNYNRSYYRPYYNTYRPYYYNSWYRPYYYGTGYPYYSGYNTYPYYNSYSSYYPYYNSYPSYSPLTTYVDPYTAGNTTTVVSDNRASVEVTVPVPNAQVWFDNSLTTQTGTERSFQTPPLSGATTYHLRARWQQDGRTIVQDKNVTVTPNQTSVVHFTANDTY